MWSAVAEKIEKYCDRCSLCYAAVWARVSQFSPQPLTPFEPRFDFPDRLDPYKLMQGRKYSAPRIGDDDFRGGSPLLMLCMSTVFLSFLDNRWPLSSPVSIFRTDLTPINLCKGRKYSAPRIGDDDFRGGSPLLMLCMSTVFLSFFDNRWPLSSPVSIFQTYSTLLNLCKGRKYSAQRKSVSHFPTSPQHRPWVMLYSLLGCYIALTPAISIAI